MQLLVWVGSVVLLLPECSSDLTGPKAVRAVLGSSVSVVCSYHQKYQQNMKYWCRRMGERNCQVVINTVGSEVPKIQNRISIKDNHSLNHFTVSVDNLTSSDSGMYSCGVTRANGLDLMTPVNVTEILQVPHLKTQTSTWILQSPNWGCTYNEFHTVLSTSQTTDVSDGSSFQKSNSFSYQIYVPFLVLICLKTPIFLTMVLAVIWMNRGNGQRSDEMTTPAT